MAPIKILVVAEDPLVRGGLAKIIGNRDGLVVAGVLSGGQVQSGDAEVYQPDIFLWDLGWEPGGSIERLRELPDSPTPIILLIPDGLNLAGIWTENIRGILPRDVLEEQLFAALDTVIHGLVVVDPQFTKTWIQRENTILQMPDENLTSREIDVLKLLAEGIPNKAIALRLGISDHTVKFHINSILGKLGAQSRTDAVVRATRLGLIKL